ncbi:MAG: D-galactarolactone cycloisomerase [Gammaproteobacteria bacterium]|jgi:D-galactarolactone cycloisomerase
MKIASIDTFAVSIPHDHGGPLTGFGGSSWPRLTTLLVRVRTDDGIDGWGEAFSYGCIGAVKAMVEQTVAPIVVGKDASNIAALSYEMQQSLHLFGRYGVTMFAISGVDIALWDIAGKAAGVPIGRLLGGPQEARRLPGYASLLKYQDPELVAQHSAGARARGYPVIKLHETQVREVAAAREAVGAGVPLCVDTNCPWSPREAHEQAARLREYDLYWLEEPIFPPEDFAGLARLRREGGIRLAAGENACTAFQFQEMFNAKAVDFAQPSVTKVGGITEFRKIQAAAETQDVTVVAHSPYFGPGWLASMQVLQATRDLPWVERFYTELEATLYPGFVDPDANGCFGLPSGPGLGMDPDEAVMKEYRLTVD